MPKMKSHKGLAKRIKVTGGGKLRYNKSNAGHLMSHKDGNRRRGLRKHVGLQNPKLCARIKRMMQVS